MNNKHERTCLSLDGEMYAALKKTAKSEDQTVSRLVRQILRNYFTTRAKAVTPEGLPDWKARYPYKPDNEDDPMYWGWIRDSLLPDYNGAK